MDIKPEELSVLDGARIGEFILRLDHVKQLRQSGWKGFCVYLETKTGMRALPAVVKGIFSKGGKDGVKPWLDIAYRQRVVVSSAETKYFARIDLAEASLELDLFRLLGNLIPPGGHFMVSYEEEDPIHLETMEALRRKVPPAATALGSLLFSAGFALVKNWYLSEGGHEGPRKLWAEKAPDQTTEENWKARTFRELSDFLEELKSQNCDSLKMAAGHRAASLLGAPLPLPSA